MFIHGAMAALTLSFALSTPDDGRSARDQDTTSRQAMKAGAKRCAMSASVVAIRVVDAAGRPVPGVTISMVRMRDSSALGNATEMSAAQGDFALFESDALRWVATKGERIQLRVRAGVRSATAVISVGPDPTGCHLVRLAGPDVITLR